MSSEDGCPLCGKPVLGRTALLGHLEFAHEVDDPGSFLEELLRPDAPARRRLPVGGLARRAGPVLAVAVLGGAAAFVGYQQLVVERGADTAAAQASDVDATPTTSAEPAAASTTVAPSTSTTAAPTATPPTPPTTTTTTTAAPSPTTSTATAPGRDVEFRKPFLVDASHDGCRVVDGQAVHTISFTFSGSRNITFDGVFHPDRSGDGHHSTTHAVPAGTRGYLDRVAVLDPDGAAHDVEVSPPIYLGAC